LSAASNENLLIIVTATVRPGRRFGGHEQRLQERTARLMRSDLRRTASHKNWAQLRSGN
jgi:hypothetical protein